MQKFNALYFSLLAASFLILASSCDNNEPTTNPSKITGSGVYTFTSYAPFASKPINCYYYVPANASTNSPIFMVLHGASRDGKSLRDALITKADQKGFIVLSPQFSETYFPGSDGYNLANIFEDGDSPSPATLNPEEEWTFSVLDPIFADFKNLSGNVNARYDVFGHSAGAQLIHRYLIFQPTANFSRLVSSAAGWYAVPDPTVNFPYGLKLSPAENTPSGPYFERQAFVIVGENDTDPNSFNLRHTPEADLQGNNRVQRAQYFFQESFDISSSKNQNYNWQYNLVPNVGHDGDALANYAADILY